MKAGAVSLVGAGPGDPELLTIKAVRALRRATVVLLTISSPRACCATCAARHVSFTSANAAAAPALRKPSSKN